MSCQLATLFWKPFQLYTGGLYSAGSHIFILKNDDKSDRHTTNCYVLDHSPSLFTSISGITTFLRIVLSISPVILCKKVVKP